MTTEPNFDPRVAPLLELVQELATQYGQLAEDLAGHLPDDVKAQLVERTQIVLGGARDQLAEVAGMGFEPQSGRYVLSTRRPGVVSGPS